MVVFETRTAIPFLSSNLFTACLCSKYASSVSDLSHLCKLGHSSDKEFHTTPFFFSAGTGFFTFIMQHLSHCSEGSFYIPAVLSFSQFCNVKRPILMLFYMLCQRTI